MNKTLNALEIGKRYKMVGTKEQLGDFYDDPVFVVLAAKNDNYKVRFYGNEKAIPHTDIMTRAELNEVVEA